MRSEATRGKCFAVSHVHVQGPQSKGNELTLCNVCKGPHEGQSPNDHKDKKSFLIHTFLLEKMCALGPEKENRQLRDNQ